MRERLGSVREALSGEPRSAASLLPDVYGDSLTQSNGAWLLSQTLCYLEHLAASGAVTRERSDGQPERWHAVQP